MQCFSKIGDSLLTLKRALEAKELARQQLRDQLDEVEKETRSKLQEIDIFNNQLKELREIHNKQQLQKQKSLEAERLKQKEQERRIIELEKQKEEAQRRTQERDKQGPEHAQQEDEQQRPRRLREEERLRREESGRRTDEEDGGGLEAQDRAGRRFPQRQEPAKPAVHAPWPTAGTEGQKHSRKEVIFSPIFLRTSCLIMPCPDYIKRGDSVRPLLWEVQLFIL